MPKAQRDKQTATQCSSPLQWPCGCERKLCQLSETGQITVICPFIIPISDSWHFQKAQLAFSAPNKTLQMWAALTLHPSSLSLNLLRQFSVTNSLESWLCHSVSQVMRHAFEGDTGGSSCNESIHGKKDLRLKYLLLTWDANSLPLNYTRNSDTT